MAWQLACNAAVLRRVPQDAYCPHADATVVFADLSRGIVLCWDCLEERGATFSVDDPVGEACEVCDVPSTRPVERKETILARGVTALTFRVCDRCAAFHAGLPIGRPEDN